MDRVKDIVKAIVNRYHTADPFVIAEKLNIQVEWCDFGAMPLGKNAYDNQEPIILLNNSIKHTPTQYFILGHELGHVIFHEGLIGYYTSVKHGYSKFEREADEFSVGLMGMLFIEENGHFPYSYRELSYQYGVPSDIND